MWTEILFSVKENAGAVLISVTSFSFQIAGAVILLLWSLRKCDTTIKEQCLSNNLHWGEMDTNGLYTELKKDELRTAAKNVYKNIAAFADILIGYVCAIFTEDTASSKWVILAFVVALTVLILLVENSLVGWIAKKRYPTDERVYESNN